MAYPKSFPRPADGPRLPDQITIDHGPRALLARFFLEADRAVRSRGVRLYLHADLGSLQAFNESAPGWGFFIPLFRPDCGLVKLDSAFWIEGRNEAGETVATQAARFFDWGESDIVEEFASLRAVYADPAARLADGERWDVTAPSARELRGRVVFSGGIWYDPRYRGIGLSRIMPRISRAYALTRWNTDFTFSIVDPVLTAKGVVNSYGYKKVEKEVRISRSFRGDISADLVWMSKGELLADMAAYLAEPIENRVLNSEEPLTTVVPSEVRQGSRRRS